MQVHNASRILIVLTVIFGSGAMACSASAPTKQPLDQPAMADGVVLGKAFRGSVPMKRVNDLSELPQGAVSHVDVVYFHRTERCESCLNAENYTRETLETHFDDQLKNGWMSLRVLDVEKEENAAVVKKYDAAGSALYLSILIQGTEYLCPNQDIWFFTTNKYLFVDTLKKKLTSLLERA
jgi:hypothetical protein